MTGPPADPNTTATSGGAAVHEPAIDEPAMHGAEEASRPGHRATPRDRSDRLLDPDQKTQAVREMFDTIASRYDLVNRLMTFGLDIAWRRRTVRALGLAAGCCVLDVACGTGDLSRELARQKLRPIGADLSAGMLRAGHGTVPVIHADASDLPLPDAAVDGVACAFGLRNFSDLPGVLAEMARVLRPGGRLALLDVAPTTGVIHIGHRLWFERAVPILGAIFSDRAAYQYLPRSVAYLPPTPELLSWVRGAGFSGVNRHLLGGGIVQLITGTRTPAPTTSHAKRL